MIENIHHFFLQETALKYVIVTAGDFFQETIGQLLKNIQHFLINVFD